ncbi:MAG: hypothetical protein NXI00_22390 [Cytophagales bacterium]|nr:hypothetical protein [Cytophagales bacterium]
MKLNKKRIIAREFLLFLGCVLISSLAFIGTFPYNYSIDSKIDKFEKDIIPLTITIDSLETPFNAKVSMQKRFFEEWQKNTDLADYKDYNEIWQRLEYLHKKDSIEYKWNNVWANTLLEFYRSVGFKNPSQLDKFIKDNSLNDSELKIATETETVRVKVANFESQINNYKNEILDIDDQLNFAFIFLIITGVITFPIRYLFYSVKWSLRTLKQKE